MLAGALYLAENTELYSIKAGIARRTHSLPTALGANTIIQTYHKSSPTSNQCKGDEAGTILNVGGFDKATNLGTNKIWAYSFQHGWLETQTTLPALQTEIEALVLP